MKHTLPVIAAAALLFSTACAPRNVQTSAGTAAPESSVKSSSGWYYFSDTGIHPVANPSEIPARTFRPWTEAVRVSDAAVINAAPSLLINRLGVMTSGSGSGTPALHTDSLFSGTTAAGLVRTDDGIAIRVYRNSFFADDSAGAGSAGNGACLAGYDPSTGRFSVILNASDLGLPADAQCVALDRIGSMWYASFKFDNQGKVDFTYLEFEAFPKRDAASGAFDLSGIRHIGKDVYQRSVTPQSISDAPDQLKSILEGLPAGTACNLRVYSRSVKAAQTFIRSGEGTPVDGTAFVSDDRTAVLFADGTFYYRADNSSGKINILKLPALSSGYVYTNFVLAGKTLIAAWEEQRFFETGRAGLLETALPDAVY
jgi:hypothetical protein